MKQIDLLIEMIKELHQNTVFIERDYVYDQKKISLDGYSLNTDEFFEKLKNKLEDRIEPKLEWEQIPPIKMTWDEATQYADSLNTMSDYGWRLPTIKELKEAYDSKLDGFESDFYWSSSTFTQNINDAWYLDFSKGYKFTVHKTDINYVRCVREVK